MTGPEHSAETVGQLLGASLGLVDDRVTDLHNAAHTYESPEAWGALRSALRELEYAVEDAIKQAARR